MTSIRFIFDSSHDPAFNMAADQCLLRRSAREDTIFVRFYFWNVPSITIGYMQKAATVLDLEKLRETQTRWIRRPTGGRAVLHYEDLTYSCIFPKSLKIMGSSVQESYHIITSCLLNGLSRAGILCEAHDSFDQLLEVKREVKLPCFLAPNRDEVMIRGKKLIGSAQRRVTGSVLQHGSIPISDYYRKLPNFLNISDREQAIQCRLLRQKSICINEIDKDIRIEQLALFLKEGFLQILDLPWIEQNWNAEEIADIQKESKSEGFRAVWMS